MKKWIIIAIIAVVVIAIGIYLYKKSKDKAETKAPDTSSSQTATPPKSTNFWELASAITGAAAQTNLPGTGTRG